MAASMRIGRNLARFAGHNHNKPWPKISRTCYSSSADMNNNFQLGNYWASVSAAINIALDNAIPMCYPEKIHSSMRHSVFSPAPKMPCGLLCTAACEVVGGLRPTALPSACAVEMLQAATLAHDDLPSLTNVSVHAGHAANHVVYGDDVAILAGDALFALAFHHMLEATQGVPERRLRRALSELASRMGSMGHVAGRYMDLVSWGSATVDAALLDYVYLRKAALMAEISVVCGALIGGGSDDDVEKLRGYGRAVGLLYEIKDDVLPAGVGRGCEVAGRVRYPQVHGIDKTENMIGELHSKAKEFLRGFQEQSALSLSAFADYAATRFLG